MHILQKMIYKYQLELIDIVYDTVQIFYILIKLSSF